MMDLGHRDGHVPMPIPFPGHYATLAEPVRIQILTSGNGGPLEEIGEPEVKPPRMHISASCNGATSDDIRQPEVKPREAVRYRECQKNHAANIGGHALDGCGEFMPSGKEGTIEALKCAACSCHRNFHRREAEGELSCDCNQMRRDGKRLALSGPPTPALLSLPSSRDIVSHAQMVMALSSPPTHSDDPDAPHNGSSRKKRHRTKFSTEQKEKMCSFADKLGWRILKNDEDVVQAFCNETGVKRSVFKVWMHNNKQSMAKKMEDEPDLIKKSECPSSDF